MFQFQKEQKVCEVGGVIFGGQPEDYPTVVCNSIFQKGDKIFPGKRKDGFDKKMASNLNRTDQVKYWKSIVSLERMLFLKGYDKAISLVSGACALCKECAYPDACKFPMEKRPTVESFYIDLVGTLKYLGIDTKVAMGLHETFKYYSIILLD